MHLLPVLPDTACPTNSVNTAQMVRDMHLICASILLYCSNGIGQTSAVPMVQDVLTKGRYAGRKGFMIYVGV